MAGLYFFPFLTCRMGPKPSALETGSDPEAMLFKRLDSMQARDHVQLRPGRILVAVYGDNWSASPAQFCTASIENDPVLHFDRPIVHQSWPGVWNFPVHA